MDTDKVLGMKTEQTLSQDKKLQNIVVLGTGLPLGVMLGLLASISGRDQLGMHYEWTWLTAAWFFAGAFFNWRFWNAVWRAQDAPLIENVRSQKFYTVMFALVGLGSFLYPLRFLQSSQYWDIGRGLTTAAIFLSVAGFTMYKIGKALSAEEPAPIDTWEI